METATVDLAIENKKLRREIGRLTRKNARFEHELIRLDKTAQANEIMNLNRLSELDRLTTELAFSKKEIDDILANVRQGILTIAPDGSINSEYSRKTAEILARDDIGGKKFADLFVEAGLHAKVENFLGELFKNLFMAERMFSRINPLAEFRLPVTTPQGPSEKILNFSFFRIFGTDRDGKPTKQIQKIMVVIDDRTSEYELARELERKAQEQAKKVEKLYQILRLDTRVFTNFIREAVDALDGMRTSLSHLGSDAAQNKQIIQECFRSAHTIKGNARALNLDSVSEQAHSLEDTLAEVREHPEKYTEEIRQKVDRGMHALQDEIQDGNSLFSKILDMKDALNTTQRDPRQDFETSMHSIVKKESGYAQKTVRLEIVDNVKGEIASDLLRSVRSMVIQLLRNAIDHGMEDPEGRKSAGKPEEGLIRLTLDEEDDHLFIVCEDDGRGLNAELIRMKALEKRLIDEAQASAMDDFETYRLIFQSGFSTAPRVTELSGRGVGLDVIRGDMKDLKGKIYLSTEPGRKTRFALKIPLSRKG